MRRAVQTAARAVGLWRRTGFNRSASWEERIMTSWRLTGFIPLVFVLAGPVDAQSPAPAPASPSPQGMQGMEAMHGMQASPGMGGMPGMMGGMAGGQGAAGMMSMQQMIANCNSMCMRSMARHEAMGPWMMVGGIAFSTLATAALLLLVVLEVIWVRLWLGRLRAQQRPGA
jgi:hypothetical protein